MTDAIQLSHIGTARQDRLEAIMEAGLVQQGKVFSLSLQSIQKELGDRWEGKKDQVWEGVERTLARRLVLPDVFLQLNDTVVLVAIASADAYEGQLRCAEVLRSILTHFLGRAADDDVRLARVSGLTDGVLTCDSVDLTAPPPGRSMSSQPEPDRPAHAPFGANWSPPLAGRSYAAPFLNVRAQPVPMVLEVVPVWRLDRGLVSAYALRRQLPPRVEPTTDEERLAMDMATADRLVALLHEYRREGAMFAIMVPIFYSTVSARRSREKLLERTWEVHDEMRRAVIYEVEGLSAGIPDGRISETTAMMRPFVHSLTACVTDRGQADAVLREYAFTGVAVQDIQAESLKPMLERVRRRTANIMVHRVSPGFDEDRLRALGASHITYLDRSVPVSRQGPANTPPSAPSGSD